MLEYIRNHPKVVQTVLIIFILPPFLLGGIEGLSSMNSSGDDVASVNDKNISKQEWDNSLRDQMEGIRRMSGGRIDPKMFETAEFKQRSLDDLVEKYVLDAEFTKRSMVVPDEVIKATIRSTPNFLDASGKFSNDVYTSLLANNGLTPNSYFERVRQDMKLQQMRNPVAASAFLPRSVAARLSEINEQEREVQELLFKASDFTDKVKITDEMVKEYYAKNGKKFELPEQVKIDYVVLNAAAVEAQLTIKDEDAKAFYEKNIARFGEEETRRASHILVKVEKNAKPADKAAAKAKAEKLLAQVRANQADFAKVAKENSDDPGSGSQGGDLGFFEPSAMVKPFADATFKLQKDQISDLVESDFGYHIILLTEIKPKKVKSFEEAKADVMAEVRREQTAKKLSELSEVFANAVDEQPENLKAVADHPKLKLKLQSAADLTRNSNPSLGPDVLYNDPKFLSAVFASQEILKGKRNTDVIDMGPNGMIAAHVTLYTPAKVRPLDEVQPAIRALLTQIESVKLAKKEGEAKLAGLKAKDDTTGFGEMKVVVRSKPPAMSAAAVQEVMKADASKLPAFAGVEVPGQGYALYRIGKVSQPAAVDTARRAAEQEQITNMLAQHDMFSAMELLKQKNKVKIKKPVTSSASASADASASAKADAK